jgi:hypothetical protein
MMDKVKRMKMTSGTSGKVCSSKHFLIVSFMKNAFDIGSAIENSV